MPKHRRRLIDRLKEEREALEKDSLAVLVEMRRTDPANAVFRGELSARAKRAVRTILKDGKHG